MLFADFSEEHQQYIGMFAVYKVVHQKDKNKFSAEK